MNLIEAAQKLGVSKDTMRDWAANGTVPAAKIGKRWFFAADDLEAHVRNEISKQTNQRRGISDPQPRSVRRRPAPPPSLSRTGA